MGQAVSRAGQRHDKYSAPRAERHDDGKFEQYVRAEKQRDGPRPIFVPVHHGQLWQLPRTNHAAARVGVHAQHAETEREED